MTILHLRQFRCTKNHTPKHLVKSMWDVQLSQVCVFLMSKPASSGIETLSRVITSIFQIFSTELRCIIKKGKIWSFIEKKSVNKISHFYGKPLLSTYDFMVVSATFLLVWLVWLTENTCEIRKNIFYFISKTLFVFEISKNYTKLVAWIPGSGPL